MAMNAYHEALMFQLPSSPSGRPWRRVVDTALPSPDDVLETDDGPQIPVLHPYRVEARSMIVLVSEA
jgi:glycogen operon protein